MPPAGPLESEETVVQPLRTACIARRDEESVTYAAQSNAVQARFPLNQGT